MLNEIEILKNLNHPNIIKMHEVINDNSTDYICIGNDLKKINTFHFIKYLCINLFYIFFSIGIC